MADPTQENQSDDSGYLAMSDEEFMNSQSPELAQSATKEVVTEEEGVSSQVPEQAAVEANSTLPEVVADTVTTETEKNTEQTEETRIDYEAEYKKLLSPFKANGKEVKVDSSEDALTLMKMGANYYKKMQTLKPNLKVMKLLENHGLLSEDKISFLIDLNNKNPDAINKMVKDSGIDIMDLDAEKAANYKQTQYSVDERELVLDAVLEEISHSPMYSRTLDIVGSKWDSESRRVISQNPQTLKIINAHMENGIFDQIVNEVENGRIYGKYVGISDLDAYKQCGDVIHARGGFNVIDTQTNKPNVVTQASVPAKLAEDQLNAQRKAASSTKPAVTSSVAKDFNPLALSDEEFMKQFSKKL